MDSESNQVLLYGGMLGILSQSTVLLYYRVLSGCHLTGIKPGEIRGKWTESLSEM